MLWVCAVCALSLFVCLPFFMHYKRVLRYSLAAAFKSLGTVCAAGLALTAAIRLHQYCWICFAALMFHAVGDYLLEFNFFSGSGFFLAGHICYIGFFAVRFPLSVMHLIVVLCLLCIVAFLLWRWRESAGRQILLFAVYGLVLSVMCACAMAGLSGCTLSGQLTAAGGALFFLSDVLLLGRLLFSATRPVDWTIMITYYSAQLLFGASCLV